MKYPAYCDFNGGDMGLPEEILSADVHVVRDAALAKAKELRDFAEPPPSEDHRLIAGLRVGALSEDGDLVLPKQIEGFLNTVEALLPEGVRVHRHSPYIPERIFTIYGASGGTRPGHVFYLVRDPA